MTQTLIYTIPYSRHYTGFTQNNSTYIPLIPPTLPFPHKPPLNSINTKQVLYKRLNVHHTTRKHAKERKKTAGASK
jgi:hypothetical protein